MINILNSSERAKGITCFQYLIALNKYPVNEFLVPYIKEYLVKFTMNYVQLSHYCNIFSLNYRGSIFVCEQRVVTTCFINFGLLHTELELSTPTCERNTLQRASSSRFDPKIK